MSHVPIIERTAKSPRLRFKSIAAGQAARRPRDVLELVGRIFDGCADREGYAGAFSALISVVVDRAIRRQVAGPIADVLRRNAEILDASQLTSHQRNANPSDTHLSEI